MIREGEGGEEGMRRYVENTMKFILACYPKIIR